MTARAGGDVWVFGYGSLMWSPGFESLEARPARVHGYHRALCVYSVAHRGTADRPGLVVGLDRGGSCVGRAFRVATADWDVVRAYLDDRELITNVYAPRTLSARLDDGRRVPVHAYVVHRDHPQYAGTLPLDRTVDLVLQGCGKSGDCLDYLRNTVRHLDDLGIADGPLHRVLAAAERGRDRVSSRQFDPTSHAHGNDL